MGAYNAGRISHQQHFYVDDEADAPTKAYVGDKLYIFNTNEQKIWDGEKWVEYGAIVSLSAQQTGKILASKDFATQAKQDTVLTELGKQSTAAKQDALAALVGAIDAAAVNDPTKSGAVIALLKGLLVRLQTLEGKIDGITDGTTPAKTETQLTGSLIVVDGEAEITTPGSPQRLTEQSTLVDPYILIQMPNTNSGYILVGSETPKIKLFAGDSIVIKCADVSNVFIQGEVQGDKVLWLGGVR